MKPILLILLMSLVSSLQAQKRHSQEPDKQEFNELLDRAKIEFVMPDSCQEIDIPFMRKIPHHYAVGPADSSFQIRYWVRPLDTWFEDYNKKSKKEKKNSMHPDQLCKSMMMLVVLDASNNKVNDYQSGTYPELVKEACNADWDAASFFESGWPQEGYKFCYVSMLHKDGTGDIYTYVLVNKKEDLLRVIDLMAHSVKFK